MHQFSLHTLFFLIIFNVVLSHKFSLNNLYYVFGGIYLVYNIINLFCINGLKKSNKYLILFILYFFIILILNLIFPFHGLKNSIVMFFSLIWIPIFFISINSFKNINFNFSKFLTFQIHLAFIVGLFGIIEFFFNRELYGLVPKIGYEALYYDLSLFYRTRSILYSIQVNALFCVLYLIILLEYDTINIYKPLKYIYAVVLAVASVLTASKIVFLLFFLFIVIKYFRSKTLLLLLVMTFILLSKSISDNNIDYETSQMRLFAMLFDIENLALKENNSRLQTYSNVIDQSNFFYGNGLGGTYSKNSNYINPESYFLQIYSEGGIVCFILFIIFLIHKFFKTNFSNRILIFLLFISCFFVHAFASPVFFGIWSLIILDEKHFKHIN